MDERSDPTRETGLSNTAGPLDIDPKLFISNGPGERDYSRGVKNDITSFGRSGKEGFVADVSDEFLGGNPLEQAGVRGLATQNPQPIAPRMEHQSEGRAHASRRSGDQHGLHLMRGAYPSQESQELLIEELRVLEIAHVGGSGNDVKL